MPSTDPITGAALFMKKVFFLIGEESGDTRGADLIRALSGNAGSDMEFTGICGSQMKAGGCRQLLSIEKLSVTGFTEVLKKLPHLLKIRKMIKKAIIEQHPDLIIAIDYPGFNLNMIKWAKIKGFKTCYYVLPQVWAWKEKRKFKVRKYSDLMLSIIPFEREIYGSDCYYVGNPVKDRILKFKMSDQEGVREKFGLFPGSRGNEVMRNLPVMLESVHKCDVGIPIVVNVPEDLLGFTRKIVKESGTEAEVFTSRFLELLSQCRCALISSGTATLEAALLGIPFAIIYKVSPITYMIAKKLAKIEHIGLPNILLNREEFPEFIQHRANSDLIGEFINSSLKDDISAKKREVAEELNDILGTEHYASHAAEKIGTLLFQEE
ncbi:lipid-A-disaccharide synthase [bacterium]|nr:lipid-A-disaccharide synthase [bacterium]